MDVTHLVEAINVLHSPNQHPRDTVLQAQAYLTKFQEQNAGNLHQFFIQYYEFTDAQAQAKFWMLGAICRILETAISTRL